MRHLFAAACLSLATLSMSVLPGQVAHADEVPTLEAGFVLRPTFLTEKSSFTAGTAFVVKVDNQEVAVTAYHLFGPAGGIPKVIAPADIPSYVREVVLRDPWSKKVVSRTSPAWLTPNSANMTDSDPSRDLVVFPIPKQSATDIAGRMGDEISLSAHTLSSKTPAVGDVVFLAGHTDDTTRTDKRIYLGAIVAAEPTMFYYAIEDAKLDLAGFNGAPVIAADGTVVGMHLGGATMEDGALIGVANPAANILATIKDAAPTKP